MSSTAVNQEAVTLDGALADLLDLALMAKQAHWNLVGPRLGSMHQLLDDLTGAAREGADLVGERSLALGRTADAERGKDRRAKLAAAPHSGCSTPSGHDPDVPGHPRRSGGAHPRGA